MRYLLLLCLVLIVLAGCGGTNPGSAAGRGVETIVLNQHELRDVYFQYYPGETRPESVEDWQLSLRDGDLVELVRISTLVRNTGYADTLVAMYITGYDPNLFTVMPLGPYVMQEGPRYCYKDLILTDDRRYQGNVLCATDSDIFFGGGVVVDDGLSGLRVDLYNANVGDFLDGVVSRMTGEETRIFGDLGLFNDMDVRCEYNRDGRSGSLGGVQLGSGDYACNFGFGLPSYFYERASRGALLIAMYGGDVRDCRNDCVLVPSPILPKDYIAGDSAEVPGGEGMYVDYGVLLNRGRWPPNLNDHEQLFQITSCYLYTTYMTPIVCIDPTPATTDGEACRAGVVSLGQPLPAPLTITSIEQHNQGGQVAFTIHVRNALDGTALDPGAIDFCAPSSPDTYARQLREVVRVVDARVLGSLESLDCRDGRIYLQDGRGSITCTYPIPPEAWGRGAYQTTLNIEIGYLYRDIQTIHSTIHRV